MASRNNSCGHACVITLSRTLGAGQRGSTRPLRPGRRATPTPTHRATQQRARSPACDVKIFPPKPKIVKILIDATRDSLHSSPRDRGNAFTGGPRITAPLADREKSRSVCSFSILGPNRFRRGKSKSSLHAEKCSDSRNQQSKNETTTNRTSWNSKTDSAPLLNRSGDCLREEDCRAIRGVPK